MKENAPVNELKVLGWHGEPDMEEENTLSTINHQNHNTLYTLA